jgi:hypothetical protein
MELASDAPPACQMELPSYALHAWLDGALVGQLVAPGEHEPVDLY